MVALNIKRVDTVFIPVKNIDNAVKWYQQKLGLDLAWKNNAAAAFRISETPITLVQYEYPGLTKEPKNFQFKPATGVPCNLYVTDIFEAHQVLLNQGVDVTQINDQGSTQDFVITDPDGNHLGIVYWPEQS